MFATSRPQRVRVRILSLAATCLVLVAAAGCGGGSDTAPGVGQAENARVVDPPPGDSFAGQTVFETNCQVCHKLDETEIGAGPNLVDAGLTADAIRDQVTRPRDLMPPDIVSGDDLDDVVAYLVTLQ